MFYSPSKRFLPAKVWNIFSYLYFWTPANCQLSRQLGFITWQRALSSEQQNDFLKYQGNAPATPPSMSSLYTEEADSRLIDAPGHYV